MNACTCCDPEGWQATNARDAAESEINERLCELFGADGENLAYYLARVKPLAVDEATQLLRDLRKAYRDRVRADTWKRLENADV